MFPRDPSIARMTGQIKQKTGYPHALSVQNTKNSTERSYETQKILCDYGLNKGVTLSMQSLSAEALKNIKRSNIQLSSYFELQRRFQFDGVPTYSDLILALPGETYESYLSGMCKLIESGQHNRIQFNNLSILPNAEMANPSYIQKFGIKTVTSDIVNMHGSLSSEDKSIRETQELVIETSSLSSENWRKVRSVSWLTAFLYFDKISQIPITILTSVFSVPTSVILDSLINVNSDYPVLQSLIKKLDEEALSISNGGPEYIHSKDWLDIYWPVDEYFFIDFCLNNKLNSFYAEITSLFCDILKTSHNEYASHLGFSKSFDLISQSVQANHWLLNLPFPSASTFNLTWNILDCYSSYIDGNFIDLHSGNYLYEVSSENIFYPVVDDWLREIVWYGNKRGSYLRAYSLLS
jgi:hypothetical protein